MLSESISSARKLLQNFLPDTPIEYSKELSDLFNANIFLKREDLQITNSYKIRGAYFAISQLRKRNINKITCASAWNHSQWISYACNKLWVNWVIYMPRNTPQIKVNKTRGFWWENITILLEWEDFDEANNRALEYSSRAWTAFIHPFDNMDVIYGQATLWMEILEQTRNMEIDYILTPIGWGGLVSWLILSTKLYSWKKHPKIIWIQPDGAPSMKLSLEKGTISEVFPIDTFVDGASVRKPWKITYDICKKYDLEVFTVNNNLLIDSLKILHSNNIYAELAGSLWVAWCNILADTIKWKNVVIVISWGNFDPEKINIPLHTK